MGIGPRPPRRRKWLERFAVLFPSYEKLFSNGPTSREGARSISPICECASSRKSGVAGRALAQIKMVRAALAGRYAQRYPRGESKRPAGLRIFQS